MNQESFASVLDGALRFVRLHGWVDQTLDQIRAVEAFFPRFPGDQGEFSALIHQRLAESAGTDEKLLALVCLRGLGLSTAELAELFFVHLAGKLEKRDQTTLQKFFFEGRSPLPPALSVEITDRVYLTYHRALFRALQMQGFTSECDSQDIILFFVQLLCRNDVFEQNRAMVHLLLSRIDGPVPAFIAAIVAGALTRLGTLIAEVENQGEAVLTATHRDDAPEAGEPAKPASLPGSLPLEAAQAVAGSPGSDSGDRRPKEALPGWSAPNRAPPSESGARDNEWMTLSPVAPGPPPSRGSVPTPRAAPWGAGTPAAEGFRGPRRRPPSGGPPSA